MNQFKGNTPEGAKRNLSRELEELETGVFREDTDGNSEVQGPFSRMNINQSMIEAPGASVVANKPISESIAYAPTPQGVTMKSNFFKVCMKEDMNLYQYCVTISPPLERISRRKQIVRHLTKEMEDLVYIFDGASLISPKLLIEEDEESHTYSILDEKEKAIFDIVVRLVKKSTKFDSTYNQVYNLILRRCMFALELEEIGRNFYDRKNSIDIKGQRVVLWPGYVTSMRQYDDDVLLCVDITHRVLRKDNILHILTGLKKLRNYRDHAIVELKNCIIMTGYNQKTYRIDDIDWNSNPTSTFDMKGKEISYIDYYQKTYEETIEDVKQPLLVCRPLKKDFRGQGNTFIKLIPELCQATGLSDSMRGDMNLMKALASHLHMSPESRAREAEDFISRIITNKEVQKCLSEWSLGIDPDLISCPFSVLKKEAILFADSNVDTNAQVDWTSAFRSQKMLKVKELKNWILIAPAKDREGVNNLVRTAIKVAAALNFKIHPPKIVELQDIRLTEYIRELTSISLPIDLVFFIIPVKAAEPYTTIKRLLTIDLGVPSQGFTSKNLYSKGIMSIVTKVVVQMNAKLGGEPWGVRVPLKDAMVVGVDIQKCGGGYIGALTASNSPDLRSYYSHVTHYSHSMEFSAGTVMGVKGAVDNFFEKNGTYPHRIVVFRDCVSEGQDIALEKEAKVLMCTLLDFYKTKEIAGPKLAYLACSRKSGTRLFVENVKTAKITNPEPGTVVQQTIVSPEYPNFFLVAPTSRQGSISPCSYKIIYDSTKLSLDKLQVLVYKLCHLYYNWSGTVTVPSPCQYSRKLAFVAVNVLKGDLPNKNLANSLHYL